MMLFEVVIQSLLKAGVVNKDVQTLPVCILWPDKERQWEPIIPTLRSRLPQLLSHGNYDPQRKTGPAIWLKCIISRTMPEADWPEEVIPILYLPGVGRVDLRAIESCPKELQPLAELQYRGTFWSQRNGKDWTLFAFLKTKDGGVGLDIAHDEKTIDAIKRAFSVALMTNKQDLEGRRLEDHDFDALLLPEPVKDLLRWLDDPVSMREKWSGDEWGAFQASCRSSFKFNPVADGELTGAEFLVEGKGKWAEVWSRFTEAPEHYPKLPDLLRRTAPPLELFADRERWPQINDGEENALRRELLEIASFPAHEIKSRIGTLEAQHGKRRSWVWARLDRAPLAKTLKYLNEIVLLTEKPLTGETAEELRVSYTLKGWQVDRAVLLALALVTKADDVNAVRGVVRSLYLPWLEECAIRLQKTVIEKGYPLIDKSVSDHYEKGECILFVDGLRFDVAQMLKDLAESRSCLVELSSSWAAIPTVTATAKPAMSPAACNFSGTNLSEDFVPYVTETGKSLTSYGFRKILEKDGWEVCTEGESGNPEGKAWCETGGIDRQGHEQGWKLVRRITEEINAVMEYVEKLLDTGWKNVRIITDHGWLLLPGGLPKVELAKCLTETRWGRCAVLKENAKVDGMAIAWHWSKDVYIAEPDGVGCYTAGREYDHGGITLQECVIPVMTINRPGGISLKAKIVDHVWRGLRCKVTVQADIGSLGFDVRTKAGDPSSSIIKDVKQIDEKGSVAVVIEDDGLIGTAAFLVILSPEGSVIAKESTTIGEG